MWGLGRLCLPNPHHSVSPGVKKYASEVMGLRYAASSPLSITQRVASAIAVPESAPLSTSPG